MGISLFPGVLGLLLCSCANAANTENGVNAAAVAARADAAKDDSTPAPASIGADVRDANNPNTMPRKRGPSAQPKQVVQRSLWQPPAEIDPVPPPVEGAEPKQPSS